MKGFFLLFSDGICFSFQVVTIFYRIWYVRIFNNFNLFKCLIKKHMEKTYKEHIDKQGQSCERRATHRNNKVLT